MYNKPYVNKMISKTQLAFTVEDIIDHNETDWKKTTIIKYMRMPFCRDFVL
jgi:hypothetical protein